MKPTLAIAALALLLLTGCECPTNDSGVAVSASKYALERDAACRALEGCDAEFMRSIRVYETDDPSRDCDQEPGSVMGCYCPRLGCATIILGPADPTGTALHEWSHAALDSIGIDSHNHGELFDSVEASARQWFKKLKRTELAAQR